MTTTGDEWKAKHPRHWWALENMTHGTFRAGLISQVENTGHLTARQMEVLWQKADELERIERGEMKVPRVGHRVRDESVVVRTRQWTDSNQETLRVKFTSHKGWRGHFEVQAGSPIARRVMERVLPVPARISGRVGWAKDGYVAVDDVEVDLG